MVSVMSGNDEEREARIAADIRARKDDRVTAQLSLHERAGVLLKRLGLPEDTSLGFGYALMPVLEKLTDRLDALEQRHESDNKQQQ